MVTKRVRVTDICGLPTLTQATLVGPAAPPPHPVDGVDLVLPRAVLATPLTENGVVVLALDMGGEAAGDHLVDVVLRRAEAARSALVIAVGATDPVPQATAELAAWVGIPLLVAGGEQTSVELVIALRGLIDDPESARTGLLIGAARQLPRGPQSPEAVHRLLESLLPDTNVFIVAGRDTVLAGTPRHLAPESVVGYHEQTHIQHDDVLAVVVPLEGLDTGPSWWLVAERRRAGRLWLESAGTMLTLCSGALLSWLIKEQSGLERDARMRSALLTEIIEHGDRLPAEVKELIARSHWHLDGWHVGVHLRFSPQEPSTMTMRYVVRELAALGLTEDTLVERTDGWAAWITFPAEPGVEQVRRLSRDIERMLQPPAGTHVVVGIGSPHRDAGGVGRSLAEARQACVVAGGGTRRVTVRVLQELGPSRLLLGWYASDALTSYSREILGGLLDETETEVLHTLQAYLERACSTAQTARALGLHRNTVSKRIARAERILGTSVTTSDTRLALQLAIRVLRS
jgi:purine catabolism regulator